MTSVLTPVSPAEIAARLRDGSAVLVDIREPDEFAREHVKGAIAAPLSVFETSHLKLEPDRDVIFMCRTGHRTAVNCSRLSARIEGPAWVMEGGLEAWKAAGLATVADAKAPLEIMRQVQIGAGSLVLAGIALGALVHPYWYALAAFVGAGLTVAGATGFCGMAKLLALAPWNRLRAV
ncbi:MAG: rhodanese family protein [Caulobacteraceae bacterium]|nr:rhodanese family protein [Caulobacteraceae bacterium]